MKRFVMALVGLVALMATLPAMAQYGSSGMGGGLGGGSNDAPPPAPPPGSVGNPPPKMKPPKYCDGTITDITGNVVSVQEIIPVAGQPPVMVTKKFELRDNTVFEPADWRAIPKANVRILYELKGDKMVITKVIHGKD